MEKLKQYESFFGYSFHGSEVPDGEYSVVIVGAEKGKSKNDDPQLRLRLSVDEGDYRGAQFLKRYTINSEASVSYFYPSDFEGYLTDLIVKINKSGAGSVIMPREHLSIEPVLEGCHWFRHCIDDAATLPEPEWFAMLTILSKINDGYELVHRYSSPYPGYTQSETDRKFQHAGSFRNCYGCTKIEVISGGHYCTFCKHRGRNRTPLALSEEIAFRTELAEIKSIYMKGGGHDGQE